MCEVVFWDSLVVAGGGEGTLKDEYSRVVIEFDILTSLSSANNTWARCAFKSRLLGPS
jgi:hypothetical protein